MDDFHIRVEAYETIRDLIEDEQILVVDGKDPNKSTYDPATDTIATRYGANSPAGLDDRAMLIHECTHAIKDMERVTITALGNEAAAYIAEATYLLLRIRITTRPARSIKLRSNRRGDLSYIKPKE